MVATETAMPSPGDVVRVAWGLGTVTGHVLESYASLRPRVVVEIDPEDFGGEAVSITVPLADVQPLETSMATWAIHERFERAVAEALARVFGDHLREIQVNAELPDAGVDLLLTLQDGGYLLVEVKRRLRAEPNYKELSDE